MPTRRPITVDAKAAATPTSSEMRQPPRNRLNTSRPRLSVPIRCTRSGAPKLAPTPVAFWPNGAMTGAAAASSTKSVSTARPMTPRGLRRKIAQNPAKPAGCAAAALSAAIASTLVIDDARIDPRIDEIGEDIDDDHHRRDHGEDAGEHRIIARGNGVEHQPAHAGPGEHGFDEHRAGEDEGEIHSEDGDQRKQRIA